MVRIVKTEGKLYPKESRYKNKKYKHRWRVDYSAWAFEYQTSYRWLWLAKFMAFLHWHFVMDSAGEIVLKDNITNNLKHHMHIKEKLEEEMYLVWPRQGGKSNGPERSDGLDS